MRGFLDFARNDTGNGTRTFTWKNGRQLASLTRNGVTWTYTYDANGMRTSRSNGSTTYHYVYNGSQLMQMRIVNSAGTQTVDITYDAAGTPLSLTHCDTDGDVATYYYVTNIQGDVIGMTNTSGNLLIAFHYDAYGTAVYTTHDSTLAPILAQVNPLGYRGYVMDSGTGLYYVQSRYYDTAWGRFINADGLVSTGQGLLGNNMFAYCGNNPIMFIDPDGLCREVGPLISAKVDCKSIFCPTSAAYRPHCNSYEPRATVPTSYGKTILFYDRGEFLPDRILKDNNNIIIFIKRTEKDNPCFQVRNSNRIVSQSQQKEVIQSMIDFDAAHPSSVPWARTMESMLVEWDAHNFFALFSEDARHTDFDRLEEGKPFSYFVEKAFLRFKDKLVF